MKETEKVPFDSMPPLIKGSFLTKEQVEKLKEPFKNLVSVVRCKDCRYGQYCTDGETTYQCFKWNSGEFGVLHEQDWFCADGKRKVSQK